MRLPGSMLYHSRIAAYGGGGYELIPGFEEPGCPMQYRMRYVENARTGIESPVLAHGSAVHDALFLIEDEGVGVDEALRRSWPPGLDAVWYEEALSDLQGAIERGGILTQIHTIAVEQHLTAPLYEDEDFGPIEYGGYLDVIGVDNDVDMTPRLYVGDYKTNRQPPSYRDLDHWMQGRSYAWLVLQNIERYLPGADPDTVEVVVIFDAVKHYALKKVWSRVELETWAAWAESVARTILRDKEGNPVLGPGCNWCEFKTKCPAWAKLPDIGRTLGEKLDGKTVEEQVKGLAKVTETRLFLEKEEARIKGRIVELVRASKEPVVLGDSQWFEEQGLTKEVDARKAHEVMGDEFYDAVTVRIGGMNDWKKDHLEDVERLDRTITLVPGNMSLKNRRTD